MPFAAPAPSSEHNHARYDAENRLTQVDGGATATYAYDANGRRAQKTTSSGTVAYIHDLADHQVAEINSSGGWNRGEVYAGGRHLATYGNGTTYFIHPDWLGTERARSNVAGGLCETITSLPFGDGQSTSGACSDASPMHFTGKERDSESNLDNFGARYFASTMGRFVSADAKGISVRHLLNPQKLNKYSYVLNNPLAFFDPNGMEEVTIQVRAFIPQKNVAGFRGDNRTFSTDKNASSRVSVTVKIETDPAKNHGQPLIGQPEVKVQPSHFNLTGGDHTSRGPQPPQVIATQDKDGNVNVHLQENMRDPYQPIGQGAMANVNITVPQDASTMSITGSISASPAFEVNTQVDGGAIENLPLQNAPTNAVDFGGGLQLTNTVDVKKDLDDPNKEDKELKKQKKDQ